MRSLRMIWLAKSMVMQACQNKQNPDQRDTRMQPNVIRDMIPKIWHKLHHGGGKKTPLELFMTPMPLSRKQPTHTHILYHFGMSMLNIVHNLMQNFQK